MPRAPLLGGRGGPHALAPRRRRSSLRWEPGCGRAQPRRGQHAWTRAPAPRLTGAVAGPGHPGAGNGLHGTEPRAGTDAPPRSRPSAPHGGPEAVPAACWSGLRAWLWLAVTEPRPPDPSGASCHRGTVSSGRRVLLTFPSNTRSSRSQTPAKTSEDGRTVDDAPPALRPALGPARAVLPACLASAPPPRGPRDSPGTREAQGRWRDNAGFSRSRALPT